MVRVVVVPRFHVSHRFIHLSKSSVSEKQNCRSVFFEIHMGSSPDQGMRPSKDGTHIPLPSCMHGGSNLDLQSKMLTGRLALIDKL